MEPKLLTLWKYFQSGTMKQAEIADLLDLSPKQTSRYLQKWHEEGWFRLQPGKGRGHSTKIEWSKNVEEIYEKEMESIIDHESVEKCAKWLTCNWSTECKLRLIKLFQTKLGFNDEGRDKLIIPRKHPFLSFHPLEAVDTHSANLVSNIYNRLIFLTDENEIMPELAHSWEQSNRLLRLYIRKGVKFHDGSYLTAEDVVRSLQSLRHHSSHKDIWSFVQKIHTPAAYVVEINLYEECSYVLHLLSAIHASIYKENNGKLIGTGSFYLEKDNETKTVLRTFEDYYKERALLDIIEFVQMPSDFETIYRSSVKENDTETFKVESDSGFGLIIMNAYRHSDIKRQEVREYIHYIVSVHRKELHRLDSEIISNDSGILRSSIDVFSINKVPLPEFTKPFILQTTPYSKKLADWLKRILEAGGVPVELKEMTFEESLQNGFTDHDSDMFIHGEVFEMNHSLAFFHFLLMSSSPLARVLKVNVDKTEYLRRYARTPFEKWSEINVQIERTLLNSSLIIPLYYSKRSVLFSDDIMNITIKNFGYADFSKLWMKPSAI